MKQKYTTKMIKAHEMSILAYERFIEFAEDEGNRLQDVQDKAGNFYNETCRYCVAAVLPGEHKLIDCNQCLLNAADTKISEDYGPCATGGLMEESFYETRQSQIGFNRAHIIQSFQHRLDDLVLQAEFNIGEAS